MLLFLLLLSLFFMAFQERNFSFSKAGQLAFGKKNILKRQPVNTILHAYTAYDTHRQVVHVRVNI